MGSEAAGVDAGMKTPPRLCYHALPGSIQRPEPLGMMTPPLQAPGSVPFLWEVAPGQPRSTDVPHVPKPAGACRRLEPPPAARMTLLSASSATGAWQVAKVTDAEVPEKSMLGGPYYVVLRPPASLFDGPSVMARSNSVSCASFGRFSAGDEGRMKKRPAAWFWRRTTRRREGGGSSPRKNGGAAVAHLPRSSSTSSKRYPDGWEGILSGEGGEGTACGHEEPAAAASVSITRFRRNGSLPNLSSGGTHLWASIYGGLKQVVAAPWKSRKSPSRR